MFQDSRGIGNQEFAAVFIDAFLIFT